MRSLQVQAQEVQAGVQEELPSGESRCVGTWREGGSIFITAAASRADLGRSRPPAQLDKLSIGLVSRREASCCETGGQLGSSAAA